MYLQGISTVFFNFSHCIHIIIYMIFHDKFCKTLLTISGGVLNMRISRTHLNQILCASNIPLNAERTFKSNRSLLVNTIINAELVAQPEEILLYPYVACVSPVNCIGEDNKANVKLQLKSYVPMIKIEEEEIPGDI